MASKTANKSSKIVAKTAHATDDKADPIISCAGGTWAYVLAGKTHHVATDTDQFVSLCHDVHGEELVRKFAKRWPDSVWPSVFDRVK